MRVYACMPAISFFVTSKYFLPFIGLPSTGTNTSSNASEFSFFSRVVEKSKELRADILKLNGPRDVILNFHKPAEGVVIRTAKNVEVCETIFTVSFASKANQITYNILELTNVMLDFNLVLNYNLLSSTCQAIDDMEFCCSIKFLFFLFLVHVIS